jgi:hypothetical protein
MFFPFLSLENATDAQLVPFGHYGDAPAAGAWFKATHPFLPF